MKVQLLLLLSFSAYSTQHSVCKCPATNRLLLPECELPTATSAQITPTTTPTSTAPPPIWTALDDCCNGKDYRGMAFGCAFKAGVCKCPVGRRSSLRTCELSTTAPTTTAPPETWTASDDCCNGNFLKGTQMGCAYTAPAEGDIVPPTTLPATTHSVCKCPATNRHLLPECELPTATSAQITPTTTPTSTAAPPIWTALDDCCNGKYVLGTAYGCAFKAGVCKCPARGRPRLLPRCELSTAPPTTTAPPETWTASDDCCNGSFLKGTQMGCAYTVPAEGDVVPTTTLPTTTRPTTTLPTTTLPTTTLPTTTRPTTTRPTTTLPTTTRPTTTPKTCNPGYQPDPSNPKRCIDIDECQGSHNCEQECYNRAGSYRCNCFDGFAIDPVDKTKCKALKACTDPVDVYFVLDESDNVHPRSYKHVRRFPARQVQHFFYGATGAKFGAAKVATDVDDLFGLDTHDRRAAVQDALRATTQRGGNANIHLGLHHVANEQVFSSAKGGRDSAPDIVVVVTTGPLANADRAKEAADRVRSRGAAVIAVGAGPNLSRADLRGIASSDKDTFLVPTLDDLDDVEKSVLDQICPSTRS